jgi:NAD(P)-dependent dehydrogenase (short-subunit alcohol dehydrogenase family)
MGAQVTVTGRDAKRLALTLADLEGSGHTLVDADMRHGEGIARVVDACDELDGVVHAAGIVKLVPLRLISERHIEELFAINVNAPMLLTRSLVSKRRIAVGGSVVFISAIASHVGPVATSVYSATKAALLGAMRSMALELSKQKIRANCIAPGYVRSPMLNHLEFTSAEIKTRYDHAPLGLGEPEDVANATVFFLSDASRWITRNYFMLDGGMTAQVTI